MINLNKIWKGSKWHALSIIFTTPFAWFINEYNFMYLRDAVFMLGNWEVPQYFFQFVLCFGLAYLVGWSIEVKQIKKGSNDTEELWIKNARPDILVTVVLAMTGHVIGTLIYIFQ